ncbi:hypothetical protein LT85_3775 [Collimonas arenae]|uniref:Uncharacterized protein n=1 Tax=Collimonas arenae TaxID=279058 RepID=A0A0A1FDV5_9BURK|nr:hypothetical protein [Collimonas arenae]AIY42933.1 hypothetical protein LT85_3775 [Collimonas arenae]
MDETSAGGDPGLSEVGMLGNGAPQSQVLEQVAMRKHGVKGWEPFHYEKVSETDYEVSGGIPALIGGVKKWPGPHSSVVVSMAELEQSIAPVEAVHVPIRTAALLAPAPSASPGAVPVQSADAGASSNYLTVVLQLPSDEAGRKRLCNALSLDAHFFGAVVTATSLADEIAVNQLLELRCDPADVKDARERAARRG